MKLILWLVAAMTLAGGLFAGSIVAHALGDHGHLDVFHLIVAIVSAGLASILLRRLVRTPG